MKALRGRCLAIKDIENHVYTPIAQAVREQFQGAYVTGEYVKTPSKFPHVSFTENDNYITPSHRDNGSEEKYSTVMYEVNVYSNKTSGKKSECRSIIALIDHMMYERNFTRIAMNPVPNMEDATIYRITARYRAETDGTNIYRI